MKTEQTEKEVKLMGFIWEAKAQGSGKIAVNILNVLMIIQYLNLIIRAGQNFHFIINLLRLFFASVHQRRINGLEVTLTRPWAKAADGRSLFQAVVETGTIGTMSGNDEVTVGRLSTFVDLMLPFCSAQPNRPSRTHLSRHQAGRLHSAVLEPMGDSLGLIALTRGESGLWAATAAALSTPRMNAGVSRATV